MYLFIAIGLMMSTSVMASMSTSKVREETRFLSDKMAHEMNLNTAQYNDIYEINYDFIYSIRNIMDYVVRGDEWAMSDYYQALDIRNDDLRWVLSDAQYRRFIKVDYFYRPIYVTGGRWSFRIYVNYPNRHLFYFGVPYHYRTYCGAHYRSHFHHVSFYRGRHTHCGHYPTPYRVKDHRHSYRRSDFGSVHSRPNSSVRPHNAPTRPTASNRPSGSRPTETTRPNGSSRPSGSVRPSGSERPNGSVRPGEVTRPNDSNRPTTKPTPPGGTDRHHPEPDRRPSRPNRPSREEQKTKEVTPNRSGNSRSSSGGSRSERSSVSSGSSEKRSSSGSGRGNSRSSSSSSSERGSGSRR